MKNIVLVGFMGTGKTVVGKRLAEKLKMRYVSLDAMIVDKEGRTIEDIFREMERRILERLKRGW